MGGVNSRPSHPEIAVLLSGGLDSMACAHFYCTLNRSVCGIFVDYGQPAASHELVAASAIARYLNIPLFALAVRAAHPKRAGEIPARNAFLLCLAAMERPASVRALAIGIHAGTPYADCSCEFISSMKAVLSMQSRPLDVLAPFLEWQKADIILYSTERRLPIDVTYSCEAGTIPVCGRCASCLDRRSIDARS